MASTAATTPSESSVMCSGKQSPSMVAPYLFLTKTMIGSGFLFLASTAVTSGYVFSLLMLTVMAVITWVSLHLIAVVSLEIGGEDVSFYRACEVLAPRMKYVNDTTVAVYCVFVAAAFLIVFGTQLSSVIYGEHWFDASQYTIDVILKCALVAISAPVCYAKSLTATTIPNAVGMLCLVYVYAMCFIYADFNTEADVSPWPISVPSILSGLTTFMLAYCCQGGLFSVLNDVKGVSVKRVSVTSAVVAITGFVVYLPAMILPYVTYGKALPSNFLDILPADQLVVKLARALLALSMAVTFPLLVHPTRRSFNTVVFKTGEVGLANRIVVTTVIMALTLAGAVFLKESLGPIIKVSGLLGGNTMCFFMPPFLYRRAHKARPDMAGRSQALYVVSTAMMYASFVFYPLCLGSIIYDEMNA